MEDLFSYPWINFVIVFLDIWGGGGVWGIIRRDKAEFNIFNGIGNRENV